VTTELSFDGVMEEAEIRERVLAQDALRTKGFVDTPHGVRVVQGVGPRIEIRPPTKPVPPDLIGKVVVINREDPP
jgi:hypothetical protein